jgi:hypothetical protein
MRRRNEQSMDFVKVLGSVAAVIEALPVEKGVPAALVNYYLCRIRSRRGRLKLLIVAC